MQNMSILAQIVLSRFWKQNLMCFFSKKWAYFCKYMAHEQDKNNAHFYRLSIKYIYQGPNNYGSWELSHPYVLYRWQKGHNFVNNEST